jgi:hypothetical protein
LIFFAIIRKGSRCYTFKWEVARWILFGAKLTDALGIPTNTLEPSAKPYEKGTFRVLAKPPKRITAVPEKIQKLDEAATEKIKKQMGN